MPSAPEYPRMIARERSPLLFLLIAALLVSCASDPSTPDVFNGSTIAIIGPDGNVYVGDGYYNSRIAVFTRSGEFVREWGAKGTLTTLETLTTDTDRIPRRRQT